MKIEELFLHLEIILLEEKIEKLILEIKEMQLEGDDKKIREKMKEYSERLQQKDSLVG